MDWTHGANKGDCECLDLLKPKYALKVETFRILIYTERFREGFTDFRKLT